MYSEASQAVGATAVRQSAMVTAFSSLTERQYQLGDAIRELLDRLEPVLSAATPTKEIDGNKRAEGESPLVEEVNRATEREGESIALVRDILRRLTV